MTFMRMVFKELKDNSEAFDFYHARKELEQNKRLELETSGFLSPKTIFSDAIFNNHIPKKVASIFQTCHSSVLKDFCHRDYYTRPFDQHHGVLGFLNPQGDLSLFQMDKMEGNLEDVPTSKLGQMIREKDETVRNYTYLRMSENKPEFVAVAASDSAFICDIEYGPLLQFKSRSDNKILTLEFGSDPSICFLGRQRSLTVKDHRAPTLQHFDTQNNRNIKVLHSFPYLFLGGNDNSIRVYDCRRSYHETLQVYREHTAGVRALMYKDGRLYSGGGTDDKCVKIWSLNKPESIDTKLTEAQVLDIHDLGTTILSVHGFGSTNGNFGTVWTTYDDKLRVRERKDFSQDRPLFSSVFKNNLLVGSANTMNSSTEFSKWELLKRVDKSFNPFNIS